MSRAPEPRVFSIAPGAAFLATFADALVAGKIVPGFPDAADPLSLASATVFLPTRRAARALATLIAGRVGGGGVLLPRIVPLGDVDQTEVGLGTSAETLAGLADTGALAPAIADTERLLILTRLVLAWARSVDRAILRLGADEALLVPSSPADALALAGDLASLMDALTTQDLAWDALRGLVEERFSQHYAITLAFLEIAARTWPAILAERAASDPVSRRNALLGAEAERLMRDRPPAPMIAAGSTGSIPATARLLSAISRLPNGAVVLPGLDRILDEPSWEAIGGEAPNAGGEPADGHPQAALFHLLRTIGITRAAVMPLGEPPPGALARARFVSEALRPAATTELWASAAHRPNDHDTALALAGVRLVEAPDERTEALCAALALREALETPGRTAALLTPDRGLAERVATELKRWDIAVEDSAGLALSRTAAGRLARLVADVAASEAAPRALVALVGHPLATFGLTPAEAGRAAAVLEIGLLRGPAPPPGLAGLAAIIPTRREAALDRRAARPLNRLGQADWHLVEHLVSRLRAIFAGFAPGGSDPLELDLAALALVHRRALEAVALPAEGEDERLFASEAGQELAALFDDIASGETPINGRFVEYPAFFEGLAAGRVVRSNGPSHRRVKIWGLLEARLLHADRLVLGGLDERVWPPTARTDAFLNRPMRNALGLPAPERRIGQTAHDFTQAVGIADVVVTRALKRDGAPTVPSRFLQRMQALAGKAAWERVRADGAAYLKWASRLDEPRDRIVLRRPAPRPPVDLVPRSLSVTEVETLVRDPYAIFARHVLKLDPLDNLAIAPGAADRGTIVHEAFGRFAMRYPQELPDDALKRFIEIGREAFTALAAYPNVVAQWWPRFVRLAGAFVGWERLRRPALASLHVEIAGRLTLHLADGSPFTLRGRADRIERRVDGGFTIVDFKTGAPPSGPQVFAGFSPQLTLEAAMLRRGAFAGLAANKMPIDLLYVQASGGREPLADKPVKPTGKETRTVEELIDTHLMGLERLLMRYTTGEAGFMARPFAQYALRFNEYDHLSRVREWSATGGVDGGEGGTGP